MPPNSPNLLDEWENPNYPLIQSLYRLSLLFLLLCLLLLASYASLRTFHPSFLSGWLAPKHPAFSQANTNAIPKIAFVDITQTSGLHFTHYNGAFGAKYLPETMGSGVAFLDYDNDGDQDLFLLNGNSWPDDPSPSPPSPCPALFENIGKGRFTEVTQKVGLCVPLHAFGIAAADYDGDGWIDLYITALGSNRLFRNLHGQFKDVTEFSKTGGSPHSWSASAAWFDYDLDGWLDLFVCNYVEWSADIDSAIHYSLTGIGKAYGPPLDYEGTFSSLYHNLGNGTFEDVSASSGIQVVHPSTQKPLGKALGVSPVDLNQDRWIDLVVANDTVQNFVFLNQKNGTFQEIGAMSGVAFDNFGATRGAMGIDTDRYFSPDTLGITIGNFANEMTALYVSQKHPLIFSDEAIRSGIGPSSRPLLTFGVFFFDYDLDGWLDLLTANGHIENQIQTLFPAQTYRQPIQLFWNTGSLGHPGFLPVSPDHSGHDIFTPLVGRACAYADIDLDGDLDFIVTQTGLPARLFRNDQDLGNNWIRVQLEGLSPNRLALGAEIRLQLPGRKIVRKVMPTKGYLSQSEIPVSIGLGKAQSIETLSILWPNGVTQILKDLPINTQHRIRQPPP